MLKIIGIIVLAIIAFIVLQLIVGWLWGGFKLKTARKRGNLSFLDALKDDKEDKR